MIGTATVLFIAAALLCAAEVFVPSAHAQQDEARHRQVLAAKAVAQQFSELKAKAESGDADAQYRLGVHFENSSALMNRYEEALKWFLKSAEHDNLNAQTHLAELYERGRSVVKKADAWYVDRDGVSHLINVPKKDAVESAKWWRRAAEQNHPEAQFYVGRGYQFGIGLGIDYLEAVKWYRKAAAQNDGAAQNCLGECYASGRGVEKDYAEAVRWWRKAGDKSNQCGAQQSLGKCYYFGQGVEKNYTEAVKWFRKAAAARVVAPFFLAEGYFLLGECFFNGQGVERDYAEALKWYRQAANWNYPAAQNKVGICHANGQGVEKDYAEAYAWYNVAATTLELAGRNRDDLEKKMSPQHIADAQKRTKELRSQIEANFKNPAR